MFDSFVDDSEMSRQPTRAASLQRVSPCDHFFGSISNAFGTGGFKSAAAMTWA